MSRPYLEGYEIDRAEMCVMEIADKLKAIDMEVHKDRPYKYYLMEKLAPILNDVNCLIDMCKREEVDDNEIC